MFEVCETRKNPPECHLPRLSDPFPPLHTCSSPPIAPPQWIPAADAWRAAAGAAASPLPAAAPPRCGPAAGPPRGRADGGGRDPPAASAAMAAAAGVQGTSWPRRRPAQPCLRGGGVGNGREVGEMKIW